MVAPDHPRSGFAAAADRIRAAIADGSEVERDDVLRAVDELSNDERNEAYVRLLADKDLEYSREPWRWMVEEINTIDEASQQERPWPVDKVYLQELTHALRTERLLAIPKSRRMLVSWDVAAFCAHEARYFPHVATFWQSEVEKKAAFVVDKRIGFIEDHLRTEYLRRRYTAVRTTEGLIGRLTYDRTGSYILAVAQGGAVLRTYTATRVVMDESEFMPEAHEALTAALPLIEGNASLVVISSSNGPGGILAGICKQIGFTRFAS